VNASEKDQAKERPVPGRFLVLITGAGATTLLGAKIPIPIMAEWSRDIRTCVDQVTSGLASSMGLHDGMRGDEFEEILGELLEWETTIPLIERYHKFGGTPPGSVSGYVQNWIQANRSRADGVVEAIRESLYDNFNSRRIDSRIAVGAYSDLLSLASRQTADRLICATTNYDPSLEMVLEEMDFDVRDGFDRSKGWGTPILSPGGLIRSCGNATDQEAIAVLHLHGAVGWYRTNDGAIEFYPPDKAYNRSLGVPALLLPDPRKDPSRHEGVNALWSELDDALENSTHVLILGHSLHDVHLVEHLRNHTWNTKIAVTTMLGMDEDHDRIANLLPQATTIQFQFGPEFVGDIEVLSLETPKLTGQKVA